MGKFYIFLSLFCLPFFSEAQIAVTVTGNTSTTPNLATSYPSLASALTALNAVTAMTGNVTFALTAGSETAPATGLTIGSASLNTVLSAVHTVTINRLAGTVTLNAATNGSGTPSTAVQDGILKLTGADYITINGLTFTDGNTTNPASMEYGIALYKRTNNDGCNNNTIRNCVFNMQRVNNATGTAPIVAGSTAIGIYNSTASAATTALTPTIAAGANSNNFMYLNTINGGNNGIAMIGFDAAAPYSFTDQNNTIGGVGSGNIIQNFGGGGTANPAAGVITAAQYGVFVGYNTINNNTGAGVNHAATLRGIFTDVAPGAGTTVNSNTVTLTCGATSASLSAIENNAGNTANANIVSLINNTITTNYPAASNGPSYGIYNTAASTNLAVTGNTITINSGCISGAAYPIVQTGATVSSMTLSNNDITTNLSSVTTAIVRGIYCLGGAITCTTTISNNDFFGFNFTNVAATAGSGEVSAIYHIGTPLNIAISSNRFNNLSIKTTGIVHLIYNEYIPPAGGSKIASFNSITTGVSRTGTPTASSFFCYYDFSNAPAGVMYTINSNSFTNINTNQNGLGSFYGIRLLPGGVHGLSINLNTISNVVANGFDVWGMGLGGFQGTALNGDDVANNNVNNITGGSGTAMIGGIILSSSGCYADITSNQVYEINAVSTLSVNAYGIYIANPLGVRCDNNRISDISINGTGGSVTGIHTSSSGATLNIYKNKISDLSHAGSSTAVVTGINIAPVTTVNCYNNYVGDLAAPTSGSGAFTGVIGIAGLTLNANTAYNVYNNTVYLNATSTGSGFSTAGMYFGGSATATTGNLTLRNNIIVNNSTPTGTGWAAALQRNSTALNNYALSSNNNLLYAGTGTNHWIYTDLSLTYSTLASFKTAVSPRESLSVSENPVFRSTLGSSINYLHINSYSSSQADNAGTPIALVTDDYDGDIRNAATPDIGADEFTSFNVEVNATAGTPTAGYLTVKAAFDAINAGTHRGVVDVNIYNNTTETATATLNASGTGSSSYTAITVLPIGVRTVTGGIAGALIDLNGADNVLINGLNNGTNSLTLSNTTGTTASTVLFRTDASNNIVRNCTIRGVGTNVIYGTVMFAGGTTTGNDNNEVSGNIITAGATTPFNGIYSAGTSAAIDNSGNQITDNYINDYFNANGASTGITLLANNSAWSVTGNHFYQTATRTSSSGSTMYVIFISSAGGVGFDISENIIGYADGNGNGLTTLNGSFQNTFRGIQITAGTAVQSSIQGNIITAISLATTGNVIVPGSFTGISIGGGSVDVGTTEANIIGATSGTGSITVTGLTAGTNFTVIGIYVNSSSAVTVRNNTIASITTSGAATVGHLFYGIYLISGASQTVTGNTIGNATANNIRIGVSGTTTANTLVYGIFNGSAGAFTITIGASGAGNIIRNMSSNGSGTGSAFYGIANAGSPSTLSISHNSFTANDLHGGGATATSVYYAAINNAGAVSTATSITNNIFNSGSISAASYPAVASLIYNSAGGAASAVTINNNSFAGFDFTGAAFGSFEFSCIHNTVNVNTLTINTNEFNTLSIDSDLRSYLIQSTGTATTINCNNNFITGSFSRLNGTIYNVYGIIIGGASTGNLTVSGNNLSNIYGGANPVNVIQLTSPNTQVKTVTGNTINNINGNNVNGMLIGTEGAGSVISGNTVSDLNGGNGSCYGIFSGAFGPGSASCFNNTVYDLTAVSDVVGIERAYTNTASVYQNKIYNLQCTGGGGIVYGIAHFDVTASATLTIHNNYIGGLTNPSSASGNNINGIYILANGTAAAVNVYYNTVYINASSTATNFGTSGIFHSSGNLTLRNNIIINTSVPRGTGVTAAIRRNVTTLTAYSTTSNNNLLYAGTPGAANLIYYDGTNSYQTLATFKGAVTPRETVSITENTAPLFSSTTGSSSLFLHIDPFSGSTANAAAAVIATFITDYDSDTRDASTPDIGADEFVAGNVLVTATTGTLSANYLTLKAAFDAINAGTHQGTLAVRIYNNTTETASAALNASGSGSASYTTVSIQPIGAKTVSGAIAAGIPLVNLNGADNVTINGLKSGGNSLTFSNTTSSNAIGTSTIKFIGGATNNTVTNCTILGSFSADVTSAGGTVFFSTDVVTGNGNDNNTISNCDIGPAGTNLSSKGISMSGTTTTTAANNSSNIFNNNNIYDYFNNATGSAGIYIANGNTDNTASLNRFYQTVPRTLTTASQHSAILFVNNTGNNNSVISNVIGTNGAAGSYTFTGAAGSVFIPIYLSVGATTASNVQGNTIAALNVTGATNGYIFHGIYVAQGSVNVGTVTGNMIGSNSGTGSIVLYGTGTVAFANGIFTFGASDLLIRNNTVAAVSFTGDVNTSLTFYGIQVSGTGSNTILGNNIGNANVDNIILGVSGVTTASTLMYGIYNAATGATQTIGAAGDANVIMNAGVYGNNLSSVFTGIYNGSNFASLNITNNSVNNIKFGATTADMYMIRNIGITTNTVISDNDLFAANYTTATSGDLYGIQNAATVNGTLTVTNNTVTNFTYTGTVTNANFYTLHFSNNITSLVVNSNTISGHTINNANVAGFIFNAASVFNSSSFNNNIIQNISNVSCLGLYGIFNNTATPNYSVSNNLMSNITRTAGSTGTMYGYFSSANVATGTATFNSNNFTDLNSGGNTTALVAIYYASNTGQAVVVTNNSFNNFITGSSSSYAGSLFANNLIVTGNTVANISGTGGFLGFSTAGGSVSATFTGNSISAVNVGGTIYGLATSCNNAVISNNKFYDLQSTSGIDQVFGITQQGGASVNVSIHNNLISDLRTPSNSLNGVHSIAGINLFLGAGIKIYYNSIRLNATSSGTNFTTAGIYAGTTVSDYDLRNNIVVNTSVPMGTGVAAGLLTNTTLLANYVTTSGNNLFYTGVPSATRPIYFNGTAAYPTIAHFRYHVAPREDKSISDLPVFLSTTGSSTNFLRPDASAANRIEKGAQPVGTITTDYDGTARNATAPDIGAYEINGTQKDSTRPVITITLSKDSCNAGRRIRATITDATGIPLTGTYMPRIYFNKNASAYQSAAGTFVSGTSTSSVWDFYVDPATLGGVATSDAISYYLIAQDNIGSVANIATNPSPGIYAADVNTIVKEPDALLSYTVGSVGTAGKWLGTDNDWFNANNWCGGAVPALTTDVVIPSGASFYPQITTGNALARNINIVSGGSVIVSSTGIISLAGTITSNNNFDLTDGSLNLAGATNISGSSFINASIKNITVSSAAAIAGGGGNMIKLTGRLYFGPFNGTVFTTNGNLTLISNAAGTAGVNDITNNSINNSNSISGDVIVERFIPAGRKWRFLSVPTTTTQSVKDSWMETAANISQNPNPGYGTIITDEHAGAVAAGFDAQSISGPSVKYFVPSAGGGSYTGIATPATLLNSQRAYMNFVRGNRTSLPSNSTLTSTVLRSTGPLKQNNFSFPVAANTIEAMGNPYASRIDLTKLNRTNMTAFIYVWDPKLTTGYGLGAFQTLELIAGHYRITPGGGSYGIGGTIMDTIESGQGFFVKGATGSPNVQFVEQSKVTGSANVYFTGTNDQTMRVFLSLKTATDTTLMDGVKVDLLSTYSNAVDNNDGDKMPNGSESVAIKTGSKLLSVEKHMDPESNDTIRLQMSAMRQAVNYQWKLAAENMDKPGRVAFLVDQLNNASTALALTGNTFYDFNLTADPNSSRADRFYIVFKTAQVVPVTFTTISALRQKDESVAVKWNVQNEINMHHYDIERSADGLIFNTQYSISNVQPVANGGNASTYSRIDIRALKGDGYYRIKATSNNGAVQYSRTVKVDALQVSPQITVSPNPVKDKIINLELKNIQAGDYAVQLINTAGQVVYRSVLSVPANTQKKIIQLDKTIAAGNYQFIMQKEEEKFMQRIIIL